MKKASNIARLFNLKLTKLIQNNFYFSTVIKGKGGQSITVSFSKIEDTSKVRALYIYTSTYKIITGHFSSQWRHHFVSMFIPIYKVCSPVSGDFKYIITKGSTLESFDPLSNLYACTACRISCVRSVSLYHLCSIPSARGCLN